MKRDSVPKAEWICNRRFGEVLITSAHEGNGHSNGWPVDVACTDEQSNRSSGADGDRIGCGDRGGVFVAAKPFDLMGDCRGYFGLAVRDLFRADAPGG